MGKQRHIRALRRFLRDRVAQGEVSPPAATSADRRARGRQGLVVIDEAKTFTEEQLKSIEFESSKPEDAKNFYVGMSVSGPPEAFGLPPTPASGICSAHREDGAYDCATCYPPRPPVTVTAVDHEAGTVTLSTAAHR